MPLPFRPDRQPAGVHHLTVGDIVVTALNDGQFDGAFDWLVGVEAAEAAKLHEAAFRAVPPRITVNAFLVHMPDRLVLVDGGCGGVDGSGHGPRSARIWRRSGVAPGDVDMVLATHLHPDHVGGLVDAEGRAVFPNAELVVHEAEPRFWGDEAVLAGASEDEPGVRAAGAGDDGGLRQPHAAGEPAARCCRASARCRSRGTRRATPGG